MMLCIQLGFRDKLSFKMLNSTKWIHFTFIHLIQSCPSKEKWPEADQKKKKKQ